MTRHIVTTDDDPAIRKILQIMLRKEGYMVTACEEGNALLNNDKKRLFTSIQKILSEE